VDPRRVGVACNTCGGLEADMVDGELKCDGCADYDDYLSTLPEGHPEKR
jgi:hypothetical protein